ncbi:leukotriene A-4 hydrolase-like isoform X2 [Temnothorax americanus]|uniref:leukotriene A-4 hydrolase-like isoform X2 n=1 Tax=Temnothorax americanus TaxID=1964332 RepID=UPI004067BD3C
MNPPPQSPAGYIPYSYSRPDLVAVTHTRLELSVNFNDRVLKGNARLKVEKKASCNNELVLDTYGLIISAVLKIGHGGRRHQIDYIIDEHHDDNFGSKLTITLPTLPNVGSADPGLSTSKKAKARDNRFNIQINYETNPSYHALHWSKPSDGNFLLISNSKLTHARAIFPCQDTPSNRITYESQITVPSGFGFDVMMPGTKRRGEKNQDEYIFENTRAGDIRMAPHEIYIIADKVNVCVLPRSVPEFDMQYPDVTFVSSTLLEGHYFMISTIVQNIIDSWIGRTVVIDDFKHLWLIKGLSTFIYRNPINNITDAEKIREFLKIKGINNVLNMLHLHNETDIIKYVSEKGCVFFNYLRDKIGGPGEFKSFLVHGLWPYCNQRKILTTNRFKILLNEYFSTNGKPEILNNIDWDKWLNEPDFPPSYHNHMHMVIRSRWQRWVEQETACFAENLNLSNDFAIIEFLTYLLALPNNTVLTADKLRKIEDTFLRDQEIFVSEIRFLWLRLCIKNRWLDDNVRIFADALNFATEYCMPRYACSIFRDLYEWEVTRKLVKSWFQKKLDNCSNMLPETMKELSSILFPFDG